MYKDENYCYMLNDDDDRSRAYENTIKLPNAKYQTGH